MNSKNELPNWDRVPDGLSRFRGTRKEQAATIVADEWNRNVGQCQSAFASKAAYEGYRSAILTGVHKLPAEAAASVESRLVGAVIAASKREK